MSFKEFESRKFIKINEFLSENKKDHDKIVILIV